MWQYKWGSRRELVETYRELRLKFALSGEVYGRNKIFGVTEDKSIQEGVWLFEFRPTPRRE